MANQWVAPAAIIRLFSRRPDEIRIVLHHFFDLSEKYNRRVIETALEARDAMTVRFGSLKNGKLADYHENDEAVGCNSFQVEQMWSQRVI